jgi:hypothetical protein
MYHNDCTISYKNLSHELTNRNKELPIDFNTSDDIVEGFALTHLPSEPPPKVTSLPEE